MGAPPARFEWTGIPAEGDLLTRLPGRLSAGSGLFSPWLCQSAKLLVRRTLCTPPRNFLILSAFAVNFCDQKFLARTKKSSLPARKPFSPVAVSPCGERAFVPITAAGQRGIFTPLPHIDSVFENGRPIEQIVSGVNQKFGKTWPRGRRG